MSPNWTPQERDEVTVEDAKKLKPKKVKTEGEPKEKRERTPVQVAMSETAAASREYSDAVLAVTKYGQRLAEATRARDAAQKRMNAAREEFSRLTSGGAAPTSGPYTITNDLMNGK